jgi:hypothetical protein|tara:strand:+ start:451 stop:792 length:342 start_codon:yes stop_codon:yes gene_type:complete
MNIEPLKSVLEWSNDKKSTLLHFLSLETKKQVINLDYEENNFYINDKVFCIKRNTLELEIVGNILFVEKDKIGIKITKLKTFYINPNDYYIFIKCKKCMSKKRDFMKQLLDQL